MPSLFVCFLLGLIPPLWFNLVAKPKLKDWDERYATPNERKLAMAANERAGWENWLGLKAAWSFFSTLVILRRPMKSYEVLPASLFVTQDMRSDES
jgi:hypothetical protein